VPHRMVWVLDEAMTGCFFYADLSREMIVFVAERLMELEGGAATGAGYDEKDPTRLAQRHPDQAGPRRTSRCRSAPATPRPGTPSAEF